MGACGEQQAPVAALGQVWLEQGHLISIVENHKPGLLALLQPALDRFYQLALVGFFSGNASREQLSQGHKAAQNGLIAGGVDPENMGVTALLIGAMRILDCDLGLANAAQSPECLGLGERGPMQERGVSMLLLGEELLIEPGEEIFASSEQRVAAMGDSPESKTVGFRRGLLLPTSWLSRGNGLRCRVHSYQAQLRWTFVKKRTEFGPKIGTRGGLARLPTANIMLGCSKKIRDFPLRPAPAFAFLGKWCPCRLSQGGPSFLSVFMTT